MTTTGCRRCLEETSSFTCPARSTRTKAHALRRSPAKKLHGGSTMTSVLLVRQDVYQLTNTDLKIPMASPYKWRLIGDRAANFIISP